MFDQPVDELLGHEAVRIRSKVVPPILDHLPLVEPQPGQQKSSRKGKNMMSILNDRLENSIITVLLFNICESDA